jgi:bifunctional NMN adenylyltransferase/nudix hydrolase
MDDKKYKYDVIVYIGRFEPYHTGHDALVRLGLLLGKTVVIVLGSAGEPRSRKNPLFALEREMMIAGCFTGTDRARLRFAAVADTGDNESWVADVQAAVDQKAPGAARVALLGHFKDASSYYLNHFPTWHLESVSRANELDATTVRKVMFDQTRSLDARIAQLQTMVPTGALAFLKQWLSTDDFLALAEVDGSVPASAQA